MTHRFFVLLALAALVLSGTVGADPKADARKSGQAVLEVYLDRAAQATDSTAWKSDADWGVKAALAAWEKGAALWGPGEDLAAARQDEEGLLSEAVTQAWQKWLVDRFFLQVGGVDTASFATAVGRADRQYLYAQNQGVLAYDDKNDPVILTNTTGAADDLEAGWKAQVRADKDRLLAAWDTKVNQALPGGAPASGEVAAYRARYEQELDVLFQQQSARYSSARLYDQYSLKKKSESTTANALVDQLIADVRSGTSTGIDQVRDGLSLTSDRVDAGTQVSANDWEAQFRQVLTSGLAKWDSAERAFLANRADWQSQTGAAFQEGEQVWAQAYQKLTSEQAAWQAELVKILNKGKADWADKQTALSASIDRASAELENDIASRIQSKKDEMASVVGQYTQYQNLVQTSQTSGQYWFDRLVDPQGHGNDKAYTWANVNAWATTRIGTVEAQLNSTLKATTATYNSLSAYLAQAHQVDTSLSLGELSETYGDLLVFETAREDGWFPYLVDWNFRWDGKPELQTKDLSVLDGLGAQYDATIRRLNGALADLGQVKTAVGAKPLSDDALKKVTAAETTAGNPATDLENWSDNYQESSFWLVKQAEYAALADEVKGYLDDGLQRVLGTTGSLPDLASGDGYFDEYQVALVKAQVQQAYWDRESDIATKVWEYAKTSTAQRPTDAEQAAAYDRALRANQAATVAYDAAVGALADQGRSVATNQALVEAAQKALTQAQATLKAAQDAYTTKMAASQTGANSTYYTKQITQYARDLATLYGLNRATPEGDAEEPTLVQTVAAYRTALRRYGWDQAETAAQTQLKDLVQGDSGPNSLAALRLATKLTTAGGTLFPDATTALQAHYQLPGTSEWAAAAQAALASWDQNTGELRDQAAAAYRAYYQAFALDQVNALKQRESQIRLLMADSDAQWYQAETGQSLTNDVATSLARDRKAAAGALVQARVSLMAQAYGQLATGNPASGDQAKLVATLVAHQLKPTAAEATVWKSGLEGFLGRGNSAGWWADLSAHGDEIQAALAAVTDPQVRDGLRALVDGRSGLVLTGADRGHDALQVLVYDRTAEVQRLGALASDYDRQAAASLGNLVAQQDRALATVKALVPSTTQVQDLVIGWGPDPEVQASRLVAGLRAQEPELRADIADAVEQLARSIQDFAALRASGASVSTDDKAATAQAQARRAEIAALNTLADAAARPGDSPEAVVRTLGQLWTWARSRADTSDGLDGRLKTALVGAVAARVVQAHQRAAASWDAAWTEAQGLVGAPEALKAEVLAQAQGYEARLNSPAQAITDALARFDAGTTWPGVGSPSATTVGWARRLAAWASGQATGLGQSLVPRSDAGAYAAQQARLESALGTWAQPAQATARSFFASLQNATDAGEGAALVALYHDLDTGSGQAAAAAVFQWYQATSGLGGTLLSPNDPGYQGQQAKISAYLATLVDPAQKAWAQSLLGVLATQRDRGDTSTANFLAQLWAPGPQADCWSPLWALFANPSQGLGPTQGQGADQEALVRSYVNGLTDPAEKTAVAGWVASWTSAAPGPVDWKRALADNLVGSLSTSLQTARASGPIAEFAERHLAATVASGLSTHDFDFLTDLAGWNTFGGFDPALFGAGSGAVRDAAYAGFSSGAATTDTVVAWWLKGRALEGADLPEAALARLGAPVRSEVQGFAALATAVTGYLPAINGDPVAYQTALGLGSVPAAVFGSALDTGTWDDGYFWSLTDPMSLVSSQLLGQVGSLLPEVSRALAASKASSEAAAQAWEARAEFRQAVQSWKDRKAKGDTGYRQYLAEMKDSDGNTVASPSSEILADSGEMVSHAADPTQGRNLELEAFNVVDRQVKALADAVAQSSDYQGPSSFRGRYGRLLDNHDLGTWDDETDTYQGDVDVAADYQSARAAYSRALGREASDQAQILKLGKTREEIDRPNTTVVLKAASDQITEAKAGFQAAQRALDAQMATLKTSMEAYNQAYRVSNAAYRAAEDARYAFELQDQLQTYAQNGYLSDDDPDLAAQGYQSPAALAKDVQAKKNRADRVVELLRTLDPAKTGQAGPNLDDADYQARTNELLTLDKLADQLDVEVGRQTKVVETRHQEYIQDFSDYAGYEAPDFGTRTGESATKAQWADYLVYDPALKGLRLNVSPDFTLSVRPADQTAALVAYTKNDQWTETNDPSDGTGFQYYADQKAWVQGLAQWAAQDSQGYENAQKTWGLAIDYLVLQLYQKNGSAQTTELLTTLGLAEFATGSDDGLDSLVLDPNLKHDLGPDAGNNNFKYLGSYREQIRNEMAQAWATVMADTSQHQALFQNTLARYLTGGVKGTAIFADALKQRVNVILADRTASKAHDYYKKSKRWWTGTAAADAASKYHTQRVAVEKTKAIARSLQADMDGSLNLEPLKATASDWTIFDKEFRKLQVLKGSVDGSGTINASQLKASLNQVLAKSGGNLDGVTGGLIDRYFGGLADADKTDAQTALAAVVRRAAADQQAASVRYEAKLATLEDQWQADQAAYAKLEARYLAGDPSVTLEDLQTKAQAVYGNGAYTALAKARKTLGTSLALGRPAATALGTYEGDRVAQLQRAASALVSLEAVKLDHLRDLRNNEWAQRQTELDRQKARWDNQTLVTRIKASGAWTTSFTKLNANYQNWQERFRDEYQSKAQAWDAVYQKLQTDRRDWVAEVATHADQAQNQVWAIQMGQSADAGVATSALALVSDVSVGVTDVQTVLDQVIDRSALDAYLSGAQRMNASIALVGTAVRTGLGQDTASLSVQQSIRNLQAANDEELSLHAGRIIAAQARDNLAAAQKSYQKQVADANESVDEGMNATFSGSGFSRQSGVYTRRSAIGATLFEALWETQTVGVYQDFAVPSFAVTISLDEASLAGLDSDAVAERVDRAMDELKTQAEVVFGTDDQNKEYSEAKAAKTASPGTFGAHVGYAAELKSNPDLETKNLENGYRHSLKDNGQGEQGRLIGWYQYFEARASKGWSDVGQPFYNKKLWDDRGQFMKALTVRSAATIGVGIAATLVSGGLGATGLVAAAISAGASIATDAAFTAADVSYGMNANQAWGGFAKRSVVTGLTSMVTAGMSGLNVAGTLGDVAKNAVVGSVAAAGISSVTSKLISTGVNAIDWQGGHLGFSGSDFGDAWDLDNAANYAGIASSMAGAGVTSAMNSVDLTGFSGSNLEAAATLRNFTGSLASQGVQYGMAGEATFNLANLSMLGIKGAGGRAISSGLMELHLGKNGSSMNVGEAGADVSLGTIAGAWAGLNTYYQNARITTNDSAAVRSNAIAMRALYSYGDSAGLNTFENLLKGTDRLVTGTKGDYTAKTEATARGRDILIGSNVGQSVADQLGLAVTLGHEAYRDGFTGSAAQQRRETDLAFLGHTAMASRMDQDGVYKQDMAALFSRDSHLKDEVAAYQNRDLATLGQLAGDYDSSGDYWKLKKDGSLVYDGQANLYDENGKTIRETKSQGIEGSLLELTGLSDTTTNRAKVQDMMRASGMQMDVNGNWLGGDTSVLQRAQFGGAAAHHTANHVNLTEANMGKTISLNQINDVFGSVGAAKATYQNFIEKNYGSAIGYLSYVGNQTDPKAAQSLYSGAYTESERSRIQTNISFLQSVQKNGINYGSVVPGASQTTGFEVDVNVNLSSSSVAGATSFSEEHTGFDFGSGGKSVNTPGGIWSVITPDDHKLYLQLYGTDVRMRVQHLNPDSIAGLTMGTLIGSANGSAKIADYPTLSYGSGSGPHVHIDFTRSLAGSDTYQRMFVNPSNWSQGSQLNYSYTYYNANKIALPGYPKPFNRY